MRAVDLKSKKAVLLTVIILVSVGIYLNSLFCEFVSDDTSQVLNNEWIRSFGNIGVVFFKSAWSFLDVELYSNFYRPFMHIFYMLGYKLSGLEPWGFHAINILIHTLNAVMVFFLTCSIVDTASSESGEGTGNLNLFAGFFAALLFAANPINTEVVTWVASVTELGAVFFLFLSLYLYINKRSYLSALFFLCSLLTKETGIILIFLLITFDFVIKREAVFPVKRWFERYWPYGVVMLVYAVMRVNAMGVVVPHEATVKLLSVYEYLLNIMPLTIEFLKNLVIPVNLIFFDYIRITPVYSILEFRSIIYLIFFLAALYLLLRIKRRESAIGFSLIWIVLPLLPIYYLGWVQGEPTYADRYLYLPSAGFSISLALISMRVVSLFTQKEASRRATVVISAILLSIVLLYSIGTIRRNVVWRSALTLWEDSATKAPWNIAVRLSYANQLLRKERIEEAYNEYRFVIQKGAFESDLVEAHNGLGIIYGKRGLLDVAITEFKTALEMMPDFEIARTNLEKAEWIKKSIDKKGR